MDEAETDNACSWATFGLTKDDADRQMEWLGRRLGRVLSADGRGGSGVFIEVSPGVIALLTAAHVVFPAVASGEITVAAAALVPCRSREPSDIFIDDRADLAILVWPGDAPTPPHLTLHEWNRGVPVPDAGTGVVAVGFPGAWQDEPEVDGRTIQTQRFICYWTSCLGDYPGGARLDCEIGTHLPETFRGISGGPVFDLDNNLLGVNYAEFRRPGGDRNLWYTPLLRASRLFTPFTHQNRGTLQRWEGNYVSKVEYLGSEYDLSFAIERWGDTGCLATDRWSHFGRITALKLNDGRGAARYVMRLEAVSRCSSPVMPHSTKKPDPSVSRS